MLPNSVTVGEKSSSSAIVAALMNFIVIIGVRKTATPAAFGDRQQIRRKMEPARGDDARNFLRAERAEARVSLPARQILEVGLLRRAEHLHPLLSEISVEPGEREARAIDGRLADAPLEADLPAFQFELQRLGVLFEKAFHRDDRDVHPLLAARSDGLNDRFRAHAQSSCIPNRGRFPERPSAHGRLWCGGCLRPSTSSAPHLAS